MSKKRTPPKPKKPRKIALKPEWWPPCPYDDVDHMWALEAIRYGNAAILTRYLREADEIAPEFVAN